MRLGGPSFWIDTLSPRPAPRAGLSGDRDCDVAIIGAGFTGLWSAYYLKKAAPELRILVLEARHAGFGASGGNGGWLTGGFAWSHRRYAKDRGEAATRAFVTAMNATVDEVLRVARDESIEADILETEELSLATNPAQLARITADYAHRSRWGEEGRLSLLDQVAARARVDVPGLLGALAVQGVARINPAKLVTGLAHAVERLGVEILEDTPVTAISPGHLRSERGLVRAGTILRCTEGFTAELAGHKRDWLPLNSAQIATAPLSAETWAKIGWQGYEIIGDASNLYSYCQRSADDRLLVGARGLPYRWGSRLDPEGVPDPRTIADLRAILARLFPSAAEAEITHAWCGSLGVPRDWCASIGHDRATGIGFAGGYVGVGVSTSNLAGRVLADLVLGRDTELSRLPLVNRKIRRWEPEPIRWLVVRGMYAALGLADRLEARPGAGPSAVAEWAYRLGGRS